MAAKKTTAAEPEKGKKAEAPVKDPNILTTAEVAEELGTSPAALRRLLRKLGRNTDGEYKRYQFKKGSKEIETLRKELAKMEEKPAKSEDAKGKKKASKKKGKAAAAGSNDTTDVDDEEGAEELD